MINLKIAKQSLIFAASAVAYIVLITTVLNNAERLIGHEEDTIFAPIVFLLLLVISAATMGLLIFGKPVMLYIDGKKKEGVMMVACTIGYLALFTAALVVTLSIVQL